jgi:YbbR domain-containing protein
MKEKLTRNIGVKILSVILATLLWLVITNVNDPVQYDTYSDVPVTILNEGLINTSKQSYEIIEGETVDFKIAARRSIIESLSASDFDVIADFANLSNVNAVNIMITPKRYKDEIEIVDRGDTQTVKISIEELSSKEFKVSVVETGKVGEGYYLGPRSADPSIVKVDGPKSRLDKIKQIVVEANVEGATSRINRVLSPIALDEEGNVIEASRLTFSFPNIIVGIELYQIKEIPLIITTTGQPANGYIMTNIDYQPKTIEIAADNSKLDKIDSLEVPYDISGASANIEEFLELQEWLDSGVYLVGTDTTAAVNITIEKLETKQLSIWPNDIEIKNKADTIQVAYITKGPINVNVLGPSSEIESVTRNTLKPQISLLGYSSGTYSFNIETDISDNISIYDTPMVRLSLLYTP